MSRPIYRRGAPYARSIRELVYLSNHPEQDVTLDAYKLALVKEMRAQFGRRTLLCLDHYYVRKQCMQDIARELGVNVSTVSRNVHRGEEKVDRMLRLASEISPIRFQS